MKYRKKPIVIEAFQMTEARRSDNSEWPSWLSQAWQRDPGENALWIDPDDPAREKLVVGTLEGVHRVTWGDYIIQGVQGELYPCKPDIFEATYDEMEATVRAMPICPDCGCNLTEVTIEPESGDGVYYVYICQGDNPDGLLQIESIVPKLAGVLGKTTNL